jgi:predicted dehydrogenase
LKSSKSVVAVAENYPHLAAVRAIKQAIDAKVLGEIATFRATRIFDVYGEWATDWRTGEAEGSGPLWDQGTHHSSLIRTVLGEIDGVSALGDHIKQRDDVLAANVRLKSGVVGQAIFAWGSPPPPGPHLEFEVFGSLGRAQLFVDYDGSRGSSSVQFAGGRSVTLIKDEGYYDSHTAILDDWCNAVMGKRSPVVNVMDAAEDLRFVLACGASARSDGTYVRLASDG